MTAVPAATPLADLDAAPFPRFTDGEYARRHAAVDALRAEAGCDALVVFGGGSARHELQYLTAWPARQEGWLVLAPGTEPELFVQLYNHVPNAAEMTVGAQVAWAGASSAATVAGALRKRGATRVGLVGAIAYQHHARLVAALGEDAVLVDLTPAYRRMRLVKSEEEIAWTRRGAALCDLALRTLVAEARPGLREYELGALTEHAYARVGGQHGICFIASAPMAGGGAYVPRQNWSSRRLADGDAILIELSAGIGGYTGQVLRTIAVGDSPIPGPYRALHDVAEAAHAAITGLVRPGTTAAELLAAAGVVEAAGFTVCDDVVHGYGGGYLAPVLRSPGTSHGPAPELVLAPGMMVVVQPNVITPDRTMGVQTGELWLVTEDGGVALHDVRPGLLRAGEPA